MMKKVGYSVYVHKSNIEEMYNSLNEKEQFFLKSVINIAINELYLNFEIIKFNKHTFSVSLIQCSTWDTLNEPIVEDSYCFSSDFTYKVITGGKTVYHNKWQFVSKDYKGFDIEEAKQRTKTWNQIPNIKSLKSKIGNKTFWYNLLKEYNLEI